MRRLALAVALATVLFTAGCKEDVKVMGPNTVRANHNGDVDDAIALCNGAVKDIREVASDYMVICERGVRR